MIEFLSMMSFWGHAGAGFFYATLAIWAFHKYGTSNKRQVVLIVALALTSIWGIAAIVSNPLGIEAMLSESMRNMAWIGFMFFLLRSGEGRQQPRTINVIYAVLTALLICQTVVDLVNAKVIFELTPSSAGTQTALLLRMLFAVGALVLVHNLYTVSAPESRWAISLPIAALAAMWMFDLNLYTIAFLTREMPVELISTRGAAMMMIAPIFVLASKRNSNWRLRLSRSVAFQSVSLAVIGGYLVGMVLLATILELVGGTYVRLAQITLVFGMSLAALLVLPSGRFRSWLNVVIAKNFFKHRYDYRSEWMRFADTIGFPSKESSPFHERVVKSLADIFESPAGLLFTPDDLGHVTLQCRWNWATANVPSNCVTSHTMPFFESTSHILAMDEVRDGKDERVDPRAVPQWLYDEERAWAVVPLVHFGKLAGLAVLARPAMRRELDWEDLDMLRVVSRQVASYLAEASSHEALAEARQFEQFNRRFAFVMHDIKNLVSQLSILARNAEKHANNPDFQEDMLETLRSSVGKMNDLLARLSQHNKAKHHAPSAIDITETILSSVHSKRLMHPIETDLPDTLMAVADPSRVETIIGHLVQNAIEASEDGSPVKIKARRQSGAIVIGVVDCGAGMTEKFIAERLYKPFESTKNGGFGIGAYEARSLAMSMGGQLRVDSRLGKGTTFTLSLPSAQDDDGQEDGGNANIEEAA
jgi:putative PEP-CTERM system histidine kinase